MTDVDVTRDTRAADLAEAEAFAASAGELGAAVAKIAQVRAYLDVTGAAATPAARALLARLWDRMPPRPPAAIRAVVTAELGAPPEERFARWDDTPIAAASLGQVHAAEDADGRRFAVKVQYPGVAEALRDDLSSASLLRRVVGDELGSGAAADGARRPCARSSSASSTTWPRRAGSSASERPSPATRPSSCPPSTPRARPRACSTMERLDGRAIADLAVDDAEARRRGARAIFRFAFGAPLDRTASSTPIRTPATTSSSTGEKVGFVDFGSAAALSDELRRRRAPPVPRHDPARRRDPAPRRARRGTGRRRRRLRRLDLARVGEGAGRAVPHPRRIHAVAAPRRRGSSRYTGELLRARRMALPPSAILLWRQRLGALAVIAALSPRLDFRRLLADLLDDGRNPISLYDRWR